MNQYIRRIFVLLTLSTILSPAFLGAQPVVSMEDSPLFVADQSTHQFKIRIDGLSKLFAFSIQLSYDASAISLVTAVSSNFLATSGAGTAQLMDLNTSGKIIVDEAILGVSPETTSNGVLFSVFFNAVQPGVAKEVPITFDVCYLRDEMNVPIQCATDDGLIYLYHSLLSVKAILDGPYNASNGTMSTDLRLWDFSAQRQSPYSQDQLNYGEQLPTNVVDWILVQVRSGQTGAIVHSKSAFIRNDGVIVYPSASANKPLPIPYTPSNNSYHVIVRHRNHLDIQSAGAVTVGYSSPTTPYDMTSSSNVYASGSASVRTRASGEVTMWPGDGSGNGLVTASDRNIVWRQNNGLIEYNVADYNMNGIVSASDANITWRIGNGYISQVP